jgi:hypothetical protein
MSTARPASTINTIAITTIQIHAPLDRARTGAGTYCGANTCAACVVSVVCVVCSDSLRPPRWKGRSSPVSEYGVRANCTGTE